jgi:hypothetical protein
MTDGGPFNTPLHDGADDRPEVVALRQSLKRDLPALSESLAECHQRLRAYEDLVYRFYHGSLKVYSLQELTVTIVEQLRLLQPDCEIDTSFAQVVAEGTGVAFSREHNVRWLEITRPILEAFFHAKYFLEMVVRYGSKLEHPPSLKPSGWAALLCLFGLPRGQTAVRRPDRGGPCAEEK